MISIVVVTYNRLEKLRICISHIEKQSYPFDRLYIIDNASTDGTKDYLDAIALEKVKVIHMHENTGGAGGFFYGIKQAYLDGSDWIWIMDDDAYPESNALEKMMNMTEVLGERACYWSNCNKDTMNQPYKIVDSWMFVGAMISRFAIEKTGFPRADFFIYHDDSEYAYRIRKAGIPIYKVRDSIIQHQDVGSLVLFRIHIRGKEYRLMKLPKRDWQFYYQVRNDILRYPYSDINKYYAIFVLGGARFLKALLLSPKFLPAFFRALWDGIRGKNGKTMSP